MSANPSPKKKPARRHVRKSAKRSPKSPPKKRNRRRLDLKPGQPEAKSKLTHDLQQRICNVVAAGQSRERAASLNGINRSTIRNWLLKAQEDPKSRYAEFAAALELADDQAIAMMVDRLLKDPDQKWTWKILKNKRPEEFNERLHIKSELSGPDGSPIPIDAGKHFTVNVTCRALEEEEVQELMPVVNGDGTPVQDADNPYKNR
jgi:hypothetical protein